MLEGVQEHRIHLPTWNECARREVVRTRELPLVLQTALPPPLLPASGRFPAPPYQDKQHHGRAITGTTKAAPYDPNSARASTGWIPQALPNRLHNDSRPLPGHAPRHLCLVRLSSLQPLFPQTQTTDSRLVSESMKCIVGEPTQAERIATHHSPFSERHRQLDTLPTLRHHHLRP